MVVIKDAAKDPVYGDPTRRFLPTIRFRSSLVNKPEDGLIGVTYDWYPVNSDIVIRSRARDCRTEITWLVCWATRMFGDAPKNTIFHCAFSLRCWQRDSLFGHDLLSGSAVVATGSLRWNWGLDDCGRTF